MICFLVTAIGGDIAQGVARVLRSSFPDCKIIGSDIRQRHTGQMVVDHVEIAPSAAAPEFLGWLEATIKKYNVDFCIPVSEPELAVIQKDGLTQLAGAPLVTCGNRCLWVGLDKLRTSEFLSEIGLPVPWVKTDRSDITLAHLPCIYKPRSGSGSQSVFKIDTMEDADWYSTRQPCGIFQELLLPDNAEYTCAVFRSAQGETSVLQLHRELQDGATVWAEVVDIPEISRICIDVAEGLELRGSMNIQLRLTNEGPRIFEINPRFSSTSEMRHLMGFKDLVWTILDLQGQSPKTVNPPIGLTGVRMSRVAILPTHDDAV